MKNFVSVSTNAARIQDISLNPQKLAGMCAKLKCCLNYEVDDYVEAGRKMPARDVVLETLDSDYYLFKSDILAGLATYSTGKGVAANLVTITAERARAIIEMNKRGEKPESLAEDGKQREGNQHSDLLADADLSRFEKNKKKKNKKPRQQANEAARPANENAQQPTAEGNAQPKAENAQQPKGDNAQPKAENGQQPKGENGQQPRRDNNRNNRNNNRQRPRQEGQRRNNNGPRGENGPRNENGQRGENGQRSENGARGENRQPRNNAEAKPSAPQQPKQQPAPQQPKQQNTTGNEG